MSALDYVRATGQWERGHEADDAPTASDLFCVWCGFDCTCHDPRPIRMDRFDDRGEW